MRGYFKEERFFVQKTKDGKDGYAIFAPFVTSHANNQSHPLVTFVAVNASGIMVNLGWVPLENRGEVALDNEPLGKLVIFFWRFKGKFLYRISLKWNGTEMMNTLTAIPVIFFP